MNPVREGGPDRSGVVCTVVAYAVVGLSTLVASRAHRRILVFVLANAVLLLLAVIAVVAVSGAT